MRYLKVLLLIVLFFLSMVFFFQNQAVLSTEMELHLNLFFIEPMKSIPLPFYFLVLAAFVTGAVLAVLALIWDKMHLSAKHMRASWRVKSLEKEVLVLKNAQEKAAEERLALEQTVLEYAPQPESEPVKSGGFFSRKNKENDVKSVAQNDENAQDAESKTANEQNTAYDVKAPDPDKQV